MSTRAKRVFTKVLYADSFQGKLLIGEAARDPVTWTVQEDIEIIGWFLHVGVCNVNENDGFATCSALLSQSDPLSDGRIATVSNAHESWNTVPAFGQIESGKDAQMLPAGEYITVKEEGNVTLYIFDAGKSADYTVWNVQCIIYYHRKG